MLKIAVCDDNKVMLDYVSQVIKEHFAGDEGSFSVHGYTSGEMLLAANSEEHFDVLFLDIQMPEIDGFEIAGEVRKRSPNVSIIFITANDLLVYQSFNYQPFDFIRKGDGRYIKRDITKALTTLNELMKRFSVITLKIAYTETAKVIVNDVLYLETDGHYIKYYTRGGEVLRVRGEMQKAQHQMDRYGFIRIHRKFLVNPFCIRKISIINGTVMLTDGKVLEIGRNYKEEVSEKYGSFCSNGYR